MKQKSDILRLQILLLLLYLFHKDETSEATHEDIESNFEKL